jgi:hypothetical protein
MTMAFNPVEELRRHGMCGDALAPETEQVINTLSEAQVSAFVKVKERVDLLSTPEVQGQSTADGSLALAMMRVMHWDSPSVAQLDPEVEGMGPKEGNCACLCTGSGGGSGSG